MLQAKYQAAHHELVASAKAVQLAHKLMPGAMVGCMLAAGQYYPRTCAPADVQAAADADRDNYFFIDVQSRGEYPVWAKKQMERAGIQLRMEPGDEALLKEGVVDFISFSYYSSRCITVDKTLLRRCRRQRRDRGCHATPTSRPASGAGPSTRWACASP